MSDNPFRLPFRPPHRERFDRRTDLLGPDEGEAGFDANGSPEDAYDRRADQRAADEIGAERLRSASQPRNHFERNRYFEQPVPTSGPYADELARRRGRWWLVALGALAGGIGGFVAWLVQ